MPRCVPCDQAVTGTIEAAGLGLKLNRNLFHGPEREPTDGSQREVVPRQCVFVLSVGGEAPVVLKGAAKVFELRSSVSVRVRSEVGQFEVGQKLSRNVWFSLHTAELGGGYFECECLESEPHYLGVDDAGQHRWEILLRTIREEVL